MAEGLEGNMRETRRETLRHSGMQLLGLWWEWCAAEQMAHEEKRGCYVKCEDVLSCGGTDLEQGHHISIPHWRQEGLPTVVIDVLNFSHD